MASITQGVLNHNTKSVQITVPNGTVVSSVLVKEQVNNQKITPDITVVGTTVTVTLNEDYTYNNDFDVIVTSI